eukprot:jgi/Hompol1/2365/HPOL_002919-RA
MPIGCRRICAHWRQPISAAATESFFLAIAEQQKLAHSYRSIPPNARSYVCSASTLHFETYHPHNPETMMSSTIAPAPAPAPVSAAAAAPIATPTADTGVASGFGFLQTPLDAAIMIHAAHSRFGGIAPVQRRLTSFERDQIKPGSVFVFSESDSGMKRWTDGMRWSKSRVEGQFLVYRRIDLPSVPGAVPAAAGASPLGAHASTSGYVPASECGSGDPMDLLSVTSSARLAAMAAEGASSGQANSLDLGDSIDANSASTAVKPEPIDSQDSSLQWTPVAASTALSALSAAPVMARGSSSSSASSVSSFNFKRSLSPPNSPETDKTPFTVAGAVTLNRSVSVDSIIDDDTESLPSMKRQRTLDSILPTRSAFNFSQNAGSAAGGAAAPAMMRQWSVDSSLSTASYTSRSSASQLFADDVLCKRTFSIVVNGVVSHVIGYYTKASLASGELPVPSESPLYADLQIPREYLDPANFRLHPKGSAAGSTPSSSLILPTAALALGVPAVSVNTLRTMAVSAPTQSTQQQQQQQQPQPHATSPFTSPPPPHTPIANIIAAAMQSDMDAIQMDSKPLHHHIHQPLPALSGASASKDLLPTPRKRISRSRLRNERLVTIRHAGNSLADVPLPLDLSDLREQVIQLFALPTSAKFRIVAAQAGDVSSQGAFTAISSGDVLEIIMATPGVASPASSESYPPTMPDVDLLCEATAAAALALTSLSCAPISLSEPSASSSVQPKPLF